MIPIFQFRQDIFSREVIMFSKDVLVWCFDTYREEAEAADVLYIAHLVK
jgi:hypothetical protein